MLVIETDNHITDTLERKGTVDTFNGNRLVERTTLYKVSWIRDQGSAAAAITNEKSRLLRTGSVRGKEFSFIGIGMTGVRAHSRHSLSISRAQDERHKYSEDCNTFEDKESIVRDFQRHGVEGEGDVQHQGNHMH